GILRRPPRVRRGPAVLGSAGHHSFRGGAGRAPPRASRLSGTKRRLPAKCSSMSATGQPALPHLGPLEQDVMNVLWISCEVNDEPLPIRAVVEHMPDLAYTTVATVLSNLKRKGMVEQLCDRPVLRYRPLRGRARHAAWM